MPLRPLTGFIVIFLWTATASAAEPKKPLAPEDLYLFDSPQSVMHGPKGDWAVFIRRWVDGESKTERFSLWRVDGKSDAARPLEEGEPDARAITLQPQGRWLAIRSTRQPLAGSPPIPAAPPESDAATDLWLISPDGQQIFPLAGSNKPYGRVFNDPFYGRVAFSPDGTKLAFIADDGHDPRTKEEIDADVQVVRPDQGEGYTGYGPAQVWIADLEPAAPQFAARRIRRLTNDDVWYGDVQWTPDGRALICHANKTSDVESVRFSINKNYDLWAIDVASGKQRRLTFGTGAEVSPRIAPDGKSLVCLSSPRKGPHSDVYNLLVVSLDGDPALRPQSRVLFDHHVESASTPPHPIPAFPLPDECWDGPQSLVYTTWAGVETKQFRVDLATAKGTEFTPPAKRVDVPPGNPILRDRLEATEKIVHWKNEGFELEGILTLPPAEVAKAPYPLVAYPHGGPHGRATKGNMTAQMLAAAGYLVFQPNFRGSAGYGKQFLDADRLDLGGGDMRDVLSGIDALVADKVVDPRRQFIFGSSYGGFMTTWLIGHTGQFRAAVCQNAVTEMNAMWGLTDIQSWTQHELGGLPWEIAEKMRAHSPLAFAGQIRTPTLVVHSRDDRRVPLPLGKMFHQTLLARSVPTQMVIYPGEGHGIRQPKHQVDVLRRTLAWYAAHDLAAPIEIVTLGDSITKGSRPGVGVHETFASLLEAALVKDGIAAHVSNVGIGGERTDQALLRLARDVIAKQPRVVTIMYGTNDSYVDRGKKDSRITLDEYRDNLVQLVEKLRRAGIQPILMTSPRWGALAGKNGASEHPNERLEKYVAACRDVAKELKVPLVDHFADWTRREKDGTDLGSLTTDQCHPNVAGHKVLLELMLPVVKEVLIGAGH